MTRGAAQKHRVLLAFVGSIDPECRWTTVGDLMAVYNLAAGLKAKGVPFDVAWQGGLHDFSPHCVPPESADPAAYSAMVFVCGPLHRGYERFLSRFAGIKRLAVGVTLPPDVEVGGLVDACLVRDSDAAINFDLALADIGYPHLVLPQHARSHPLGVCLVGRQYEYGDRDGHQMAAETIDAACAGLDRIFVNTLLDPGRPLPASTELDMQCSQVLVTTRMHGALLALFHGIPVVAVDQIKGGAKVSRMLASVGCPVFNAWDVGHEKLSEAIGQRMLGHAGCDMAAVRQRVIERSRAMLATCVEFVLEHLSRR